MFPPVASLLGSHYTLHVKSITQTTCHTATPFMRLIVTHTHTHTRYLISDQPSLVPDCIIHKYTCTMKCLPHESLALSLVRDSDGSRRFITFTSDGHADKCADACVTCPVLVVTASTPDTRVHSSLRLHQYCSLLAVNTQHKCSGWHGPKNLHALYRIRDLALVIVKTTNFA